MCQGRIITDLMVKKHNLDGPDFANSVARLKIAALVSQEIKLVVTELLCNHTIEGIGERKLSSNVRYPASET